MDNPRGSADRLIQFRIVNRRATTFVLRLEPWGDEHPVVPGTEIEVEATGPPEGALEIDVSDDRITLWGWVGSVVRLFREGTEL